MIGGVTEYLTGWIADTIFKVKFWDYSNQFLNIQGRTTVPFMFFWGLGGTILMKVIYPFLSKWIEKIPYRIGTIIYRIFFVFLMLDIIVTYSAFGRMAFRNQGKKPFTVIGKLYDKYYDNEFMYERFPVMRPND